MNSKKIKSTTITTKKQFKTNKTTAGKPQQSRLTKATSENALLTNKIYSLEKNMNDQEKILKNILNKVIDEDNSNSQS